MIGVFVTFRYGDNFDEQAVRKIAETARVNFVGMPGLRLKASRSIPESVWPRTSTVWDSEDRPKRSLRIS